MRPRLAALLAALLLLMWTAVGFGTTVRPVSIETMASRASLVVEGQATASWSQWNATHTMIVTYTRFRVSRPLKGAAGGEVTVRQPGGTVGMYTDVVHGVRYLKPGEEAALFLQPSSEHDGALVVVGLMQGMFRIERAQSGEKFVSNGIAGVEAQSEGGAVQGFRGARLPLAEFEFRVTKVQP